MRLQAAFSRPQSQLFTNVLKGTTKYRNGPKLHTWWERICGEPRASSCEPRHWAALVTRANFDFCSCGKFQPCWPGWNLKDRTKMLQHEVVSFKTLVASWTLLTLLNIVVIEANLHTSAVEMNARQKFMPFWTLCLKCKAILSKKSFIPVTRPKCSYGKIFIPVAKILVGSW